MNKYSADERKEIILRYIERFGEDSGLVYITDINEAVDIYKECLEKDMPYEELYGEEKGWTY